MDEHELRALPPEAIDVYELDLFDVLGHAPLEVPGLIDLINQGKVDGEIYEGKCCCLIGSIANLQKRHYKTLDGIIPNQERPIEDFFRNISAGCTPHNSLFSAKVMEWMEDWRVLRKEYVLAALQSSLNQMHVVIRARDKAESRGDEFHAAYLHNTYTVLEQKRSLYNREMEWLEHG